MANPEHVAMVRHGRHLWNKWRKENPRVQVDLSTAYLSETNIEWAEPNPPPGVAIADFSGFDFSRAVLSYAILKGANLRNASLVGADLSGSNLRRADMHDADLRQARFFHANLTLANLGDADLTGAMFWETVLARVNFTGALGMEACRHGGPSIIDERTLRRSGGLPIEFLRGCGLSDGMIRYIPNLLKGANFHSCFISYASKDQDFAEYIHKSLQRRGVRCWFAPHDVQAGKKLHEQIDEAIRLHERLLLVLSPHSINSEWVKTEIAKARKRETIEGNRVLFPIRLNISFQELQDWECFDADRGKDSAREIREYYIPDFTKWRNREQYQEEFTRLLRDLKKEIVIAPTA